MSITFAVDDVTPFAPSAPAEPGLAERLDMATSLEQQLGTAPLAISHDAELIPGGRWDGRHGHPLVVAVHRAFARHRPLILSPDVVWLTLAQGFAAHIENNAEALRGRFVRHEGRAILQVPVMSMPETADDWRGVVEGFGDRLAEHVGPGMRRLMRCDFSTTDAVARTASGVVMMSAFRRYFEYQMVCICGIPRITLEGTVEDWQAIRERIDVMAEYDLEWWTERLAPVADEWVRTAAGEPDRTFWRSIYKPQQAYGADTITGWLNRLFPYIRGERNAGMRPASALTGEERASWAARFFGGGKRKKLRHAEAKWIDVGISTMDPPGGLSAARVRVMAGSTDAPDPRGSVLVVGGLVGARIDTEGAVRVEPGWAVCAPDRATRLVETLRVKARSETPKSDGHPGRFSSKSAERVAFDAEIGEAWLNGVHLRSAAESWPVQRVGDGFFGVRVTDRVEGGYSPAECLRAVADLGPDDPRWLGSRLDGAIALVDPTVEQPADALPLVALDYGGLIEGALASDDGLWFDRDDFTPLPPPPGNPYYD